MSFQLQNSEVLARLKPFGISFEKSLTDLIKGIRQHSKDSPESLSTFLDVVIQECKTELSTTDLETKAMAVLKLAYLEMFGFDMSWCNFQILEVMSSAKFQQKRIGYLAAIQSFKNEQDLLILATNQFKKDLNSHNHTEIGLALSGIATIVTPNLSKDINDDVLMKLSHSKPYIRKKAILAMYKIFLQYPESLRVNFQRIIDMLDDTDVSVVSATVNVICEISKKNPNIFINYLPKFFTILEDTKNNWLIIRILKLFQSLSKVEPRMKKKILPTILDLIVRTQASSLIYECINCIVNGNMLSPDSSKDKETAKICIKQIMDFFKTKDSNLKFVGLIALINILKIFPVFMHKVDGVSAIIMDCLTDPDLIIKRKALEICHYLVQEDNIAEVVKVLLLQLIPSDMNSIPETLKEEVTLKILSITSQDNYANIPNFKWYIAVLKDIVNLTLLPLPSSSSSVTISPATANTIAHEIGREFKELATKVPSIRPDILSKVIIDAVQDVRILEICPSLLRDFYWIMGEYIDELKTPDDEDSDGEENETEHSSIVDLGKKIQIFNTIVNQDIDKILGLSVNVNFPVSSKLISLSDYEVQIVLVQALVKLFSGIVSDYLIHYSADGKLSADKFNQIGYYLYKLIAFLSNWEHHTNFEVQERALSWLEFLKLSLEAMKFSDLAVIKELENDEVEYYRNLPKEKKEQDEDDSISSEEEENSGDDDEEEDEDSEDESSDDNSLEVQANPFSSETNSEALAEGMFEGESLGSDQQNLPMLLTHILPSFFKSYQLNPIAKNSQRKIPLPEDLDLETPINPLPFNSISDDDENDGFNNDEYDLFIVEEVSSPAEETSLFSSSNRGSDEDLKKKKERLEKLRDDPYYIGSKSGSKKSKSKSKRLLFVDDGNTPSPENFSEHASINSNPIKEKKKKPLKLKKNKVVILSEETIEGGNKDEDIAPIKSKAKKRSNVLKIDSSNLDNFDLNSTALSDSASGLDKDYEYDIDLDELRKKLAESSQKEMVKKEKKDKKKKSTSTKKSSSKEKASEEGTKTTKPSVLESEPNLEASKSPTTTTVETNVITIKKPKKSKKKKAAIIE
ncbi:adaptin N terminal region-domain-containing protein [Scheffersomyces xylosifermentans]|uniref:adaptin N terminal region-domain-containing protein n=1 Tax=Scheffersomyces xylosifermentans TaxID=1304137 RepID=UPI00315D07B4